RPWSRGLLRRLRTVGARTSGAGRGGGARRAGEGPCSRKRLVRSGSLVAVGGIGVGGVWPCRLRISPRRRAPAARLSRAARVAWNRVAPRRGRAGAGRPTGGRRRSRDHQRSSRALRASGGARRGSGGGRPAL